MAQYGGKILYSTVTGTAAVFTKTARSLEVGGGGVLTDLPSRAHVWGAHQMIRENERSFLACVRAECSKFPYVLTGL